MKTSLHKNRPACRTFSGWLGLLLYLGAVSPLGFAVTAFVGKLDPDHHIQFQPGANGMRLVLHHEGNCAGHHHGAVARVLTVFAQPASATDPDHVIQFGTANGLTRQAQFSPPLPVGGEQTIFAPAEIILLVCTSLEERDVLPRPPPREHEALLCLRSTVLLI